MTWLGISKMGGQCALINFNLRQKSLAHCLKVSKATMLVFDKELEEALAEVLPELGDLPFQKFCFDGESQLGPSLTAELQKQPHTKLPAKLGAHQQGVKTKDPVLFIYTVRLLFFQKKERKMKELLKIVVLFRAAPPDFPRQPSSPTTDISSPRTRSPFSLT